MIRLYISISFFSFHQSMCVGVSFGFRAILAIGKCLLVGTRSDFDTLSIGSGRMTMVLLCGRSFDCSGRMTRR